MALVFHIAFLAGFGVVLASFLALLAGRATRRDLLAGVALLATGSLAGFAALGINLVERFTDTEPVLLAAAGLGAAAAAQAGVLALLRGLGRLRDEERVLQAGRERIEAALAAHADKRGRDLEQTLARERANATHLLGQQERKLSVERRDLVARQADRARAELARSIEQVQDRLEQRLAAWAADLDRGQRALEARLNALAQRQAEAIKAYEARLAADSDHLRALTEEQQAAINHLRVELEHVGREALDAGRAEIEAHADERRRAITELAARFRAQERELLDHVAREEADSLARVNDAFAQIERREREKLERLLDRAATRLADEAERRFDAQIRESREKSAKRLSHELDKAMDQFARRAEKEISDRIGEAAQAAASGLERRIGEISRAADAQNEVAEERTRMMGERLNQALAQAEQRIASFEAQVEEEMASRLEALERSVRTADL